MSGGGSLPAARAQHQSVCCSGTIQANPGVNIAALRPYNGYGAIRLAENAGESKYHSLQFSADRRYRNGFKFGVGYTLGNSEDNASDKRDVLFNNYDDSGLLGQLELRPRDTCSTSTTSTTCRSGATRTRC